MILRALLGPWTHDDNDDNDSDGSEEDDPMTTPAAVRSTGFPLPSLYERLWAHGITKLGPWTLLEGEDFLSAYEALSSKPLAESQQPGDSKKCVWLPLARRDPDGLLACAKVIPREVRIHLIRLGKRDVVGELASFAEWLRWAIEDLIRVDAGRAPAPPLRASSAVEALLTVPAPQVESAEAEEPEQEPAETTSTTSAQSRDTTDEAASRTSTRRHLLRKLRQSDVDLDFVSAEAGDQDLTSAVLRRHHDRIKRRRGDRIYADMLFVLTQQRYPSRMAKWLWGRIAQHKRKLSQRLGRSVDITVASLDFLNGHEHLVEGSLVLCSENELSQIAEVALRDGLTGLFDQASFRERLRRELRRAERYDSPVSVLMLDLDHFKQVNDDYGHLAGDRVLAELGELLRVALRDVDIAARYGGEEFALCLPETQADEARRLGDRLREQIKGRFPAEPRVTASVGVASYPADGREAEALIERADAALYHAKRAGRDRTSSARDVGEESTSEGVSGPRAK